VSDQWIIDVREYTKIFKNILNFHFILCRGMASVRGRLGELEGLKSIGSFFTDVKKKFDIEYNLYYTIMVLKT
jgi:hypothetical protein